MTRTDFIDCRADVIRNIHTLYSYAQSDDGDEREWAIDRYRQGRCFVVEPFGNKLMFGPSRFCGYKENTWEKQCEHHGNGTETNDRYLKLKLYQPEDDPSLTCEFDKFMDEFGINNVNPKFFIPSDGDLTDLYHLRKCYFISPTHCRGQKEQAWGSFLDKGIAAIGWTDEDYTDYTDEDIQSAYPDDYTAVKAFNTFRQIRPGDIICCTHNNFGLWGIGIATSTYKHESGIHYAGIDDDDEEWTYSHYVEVKWLKYKSQGYISKNELEIPPSGKQWPPYGTIFQCEIPDYITNYLLKPLHDTMTQNYKYDRYIKLLKANRNLILTGAPGTGKTHLAKAIAEEMDAVCEFVQFHPSYDYTDFVEGLRPTLPDKNGNIGFERKDGIFKEFCKRALMHKRPKIQLSYSESLKLFKEDLQTQGVIETKSFRSDTIIGMTLIENGNISVKNSPEWRVTDNRILNYLKNRTCQKNDTYTKTIGDYILNNYVNHNTKLFVTQKSKPHILIIDEINRGEISKIFGELFFSIDPGYRGERGRVKTQYQNLITEEDDPFYKGFYVPENVYIIGTMNDIDRSVESMDFAMRRRFAWEEIKAADNTEMLNDLGEMKDEVIEVMNRLNNAIRNDEENEGIEGLNSSFHIGAAYFAKLGLYLDEDNSNKEEAYGHLWENHLRGVLFEYLRGTINAEENLRLLESAYYGINDDNETD
ncbi:McrB family protein [uncultured Duncaniella sp.]|uniref:McrB family protein n=1 Tax=uncultured Duncaniella sp. TaxID=2768039 RepID=UPI0026178931|nr:AAA family ATPase [uncultured Duncaniella sp.]